MLVGRFIYKDTSGRIICNGVNWSENLTDKELAFVRNHPLDDFSKPRPVWPIGWRNCDKTAEWSEIIRVGDKREILGWCEDHTPAKNWVTESP